MYRFEFSRPNLIRFGRFLFNTGGFEFAVKKVLHERCGSHLPAFDRTALRACFCLFSAAGETTINGP